jgi:LPS-assembly protein
MLRRLFLVILPALTVSVSFANEAAWNCEQNKETKEWLCIGDAITKTKAQEPTPLPKSVEAIQPAITKPIAIPQPIQASKPVIAEPIVEPAEEIQAVLPETTSTPPPTAITEPVQSTQVDKPNPVESDKIIITPHVDDEKPKFFASPNTDLNNKIVPGSASNQPGWNCGANKADGTWNCQQIGPNRESRAQLATTEEPGMRLLDPPFDLEQEQSFNTLTSQLPYDPWQNCNAERGTKQDFLSQSDKRDVAPMDIKSNYAEVYDSEIRTFTGDVQMSRADQQSTSKSANYDSVSDVLDLNGNVFYHDEGVAMHSESAMLNLASDQAKLRDVQFISPTTPLRGKAQAYYRESKTLSNYKDVAYTSCRPGNQDWVIHASDLEMDKVSGQGTAKHTWLEFKGLPVFYSPMLSFPIDNRRKSGFLAPSFGSTKYSGFRVAAPYYWNIAPNYDATFTPRELSKRGPLFSTLFRHMNEQSQSKVGVEFMPYDTELKTTRYLGSIQNSTTITPNIHSNLDLNYVSDQTYFAELGNALSFANINYLKSSADISYVNKDVNFMTSMVNYQSINTTLEDAQLPYRTLPRVNLNLNHEFNTKVPLVTDMQNEYANFQQSSLINGQRFNTRPSISTPMANASSFLTPKVSLAYTQYDLTNITTDNLTSSGLSPTAYSGSSGSTSRTLPIFSADSGLFFERNLNIANNAYMHTVEPRLFYLYIPNTNQTDIPVFDSAQYDFQYGAMFRENSFSGTDRIQNANQVTTALTSRLIDDKTGLERLKLNVGEIFYFQNRTAWVPGEGSTQALIDRFNQQSVSNVVTDLTSALTKNLSLAAGMQWNPVLNDFERLKAGLHYRTEANEIFNARYYNRKNPLIPDETTDVNETDLSARFPVYDNWSLMGRWQYSVLWKKTQDSFLGIEKENCCWRFRVALRRYINNISNSDSTAISGATGTVLSGTPQNGIFFEFELKGITSLGDTMDEFLGRELYGYKGTQQ